MSRPLTGFLMAGIGIVVIVAAVLAPRAADSPDGLETVAQDEGFGSAADEHPLADGPVGDYEVGSIENQEISVGVAGLAGAALTGLIAVGSLHLIRRSARRKPG